MEETVKKIEQLDREIMEKLIEIRDGLNLFIKQMDDYAAHMNDFGETMGRYAGIMNRNGH